MSSVSIPEVPTAGTSHLFTAQNGYITDGPAMAALANTLNMIANRRMKVLFHAYARSFANPSTAWYGQFYCSPYVDRVFCTVLTGDSGTPGTGSFFAAVDGTAQPTQIHHNTSSSGDTRILKTFEVLDGVGGPLTAGLHSFHFDISGTAAIRAVVFYESTRGVVTTAGGAAVDPSQYAVGSPVIGTNASSLVDLAWALHKGQGTTHISWAANNDAAVNYRTNGPTWRNPLDASTTGYASTAAGLWAYPYRQSSLSETTVPVTCWVYAEGIANTGRFRLSNSAGVILTITGIGAAGYYSGTGTLDATLSTGDLIVPEYSNATAASNMTLYGFGLYDLTT